MPQNKFAIARYRLIDNILQKKEYVTTKEIVELCREQLGFKVSARTIQLDMQAMTNDEFLGFCLPIRYSRSQKAYYHSEKYSCERAKKKLSQEDLDFLIALHFSLKHIISKEYFIQFENIIKKLKE